MDALLQGIDVYRHGVFHSRTQLSYPVADGVRVARLRLLERKRAIEKQCTHAAEILRRRSQRSEQIAQEGVVQAKRRLVKWRGRVAEKEGEPVGARWYEREGRPASIENPRDLAGKRARRWRREKEREKEVEAQHLRQERSKRLQNYVGDTDEDRDNKISSELKSPPEMEALRELGLFPPSPFVP